MAVLLISLYCSTLWLKGNSSFKLTFSGQLTLVFWELLFYSLFGEKPFKSNRCFHGDWRLSPCGLRNESAAGFLLWNQAGWKFEPIIYFREKLDGCKQAESPWRSEQIVSEGRKQAAGDLFLHQDFIIITSSLRQSHIITLSLFHQSRIAKSFLIDWDFLKLPNFILVVLHHYDFITILQIYSFSLITTLFLCQSGTTELLLHLYVCGIIMTLLYSQFCFLKWFSHYYVSMVTWLWLYHQTHSVPVEADRVVVGVGSCRSFQTQTGKSLKRSWIWTRTRRGEAVRKSRRFQSPVLTALPRRTLRISSCSIRPAPPPWSPWNTNSESAFALRKAAAGRQPTAEVRG